MQLTIATRIKRGWTYKTIEASPLVVKEWREERDNIISKNPGKLLFNVIKIGEEIYSSASGTLLELYEVGLQPHMGKGK